MKSILIPLCLSLAIAIFSSEVDLGNEKIKPLGFSKSLIAYDVELNKTFYGLSDPKIISPIKGNPINIQLGFDTGLHHYINAGLIFEASLVGNDAKKSNFLKLSLFIKPKYPLSDNLSIFARLRAGILGNLGGNDYLRFNDTKKFEQDYFIRGFGASLGASLGIEYFPLSRLGFFVEWGVKSDFVFFKKLKGDGPEYVGYMLYNFPITAGIYLII